MKTFTDNELESLITCPKQVIDPPRREMRQDGKMKRNDMTLKSADRKHSFRVFMRQSEDFPENFSIGLVYFPGEEPGSFLLVRCNGQHGGEKVHPHHAVFHIHRSKADDINSGFLEPRHIEQAGDYASFREALAKFCTLVNVERADDYFPGINQGLLSYGSGESGTERKLTLGEL
jgi:hypothetical protein